MPDDHRLVKTRPPTEARAVAGDRARGLVSSRASGRRIDAQSYSPPQDLGDVLSRFWSGKWDLPPDSPHTTELLSDPCLHIVFEAGGPYEGSRLVGAWTKLWRRTLSDRGLVRGVKIRAGGARAFIDRPICEFTNAITPLDEIFGGSVRRLQVEVLRPGSDDEAFDVVADWLRRVRQLGEDPEIKLAIDVCQLVTQDLRITSVERLTQATGLNARALQRLFRNYVGGTPKWAIIRNRLQEAAVRLESGEVCSLAALAADLGFTDQSHFARDFRRATGKTPAHFREAVHR